MEVDQDGENHEPKQPRFITNNKGNPQLVDDENNLYHASTKSKDVVYLTCSMLKKLNCPGRAILKTDPTTGVQVAHYTGKHNHLSSLAKVEAKVMDRSVIKAGVGNSTMPPSRVLAEALNKDVHESVLMARRKSGNLIRTIQMERAKEKGHSAVPVSLEAILSSPLPDQYSKTASGDQFLIWKDYVSDEDPSKAFLVFLSPLAKEILRVSRHWESDGTFKTVPRPFQDGQIYIVFAQLSTGELLPCVFSLLPDKTSATYFRMWAAVQQELTSAGLEEFAGPESIGMDFEVAPAKEFKELFQGTKVSGCYFHWRKSLLDQIGKKGCKAFFNRSLEFQDLVNKCVAMAFVPVEKIHEYFILVEYQFSDAEDDLEEGAVDWFNYFTRTFVGKKLTRSGGRKPPLFQHDLWNKFHEFSLGLPATTNQAEAFNRAWNLRTDTNASFWSILDGFKREEALAAQKWRESIVNTRIGDPGPAEGTSRQILQRDKQARIQNVLSKEGTIPKKSYLAAVVSLLIEI